MISLENSIASENYTAEFDGKKAEAKKIGNTVIYRVTIDGVTDTVVYSKDYGMCYVSIDGVEWGAGIKYLAIPLDRLENMNNDTWVPKDVYRFIDVKKIGNLMKPSLLNFLSMSSIGIKSICGFDNDMYISDSSWSMSGSSFLSDAKRKESSDVRVLDPWEKGIHSVYKVTVNIGETLIDTDAGVISIRTSNSGSEGAGLDVVGKSVNESCTHIDRLDVQLSDKIYKNYADGDNIIESVKGALKK